MTTAATLSRIIWFAQSTPIPGSARSTHRSSSIGCPPTPFKYWLSHLTVALATGVSMLLSVLAFLSSVTKPILVAVPLAGFFVPSALLDFVPTAA